MDGGWTKDLGDLKITETKNYKSRTQVYEQKQLDELSGLHKRQNGAELVDIGLRLLGYGEKKLNETWLVFLETASSGKYDEIGYDEHYKPNNIIKYNYEPPTKESITKVMALAEPYKSDHLLKDLSELEWQDYREIAILSKRDLCYVFIHPVVSARLERFGSEKLSRKEGRFRDSLVKQAPIAANWSRDDICGLYSEIAAESALGWYRINLPELFKK